MCVWRRKCRDNGWESSGESKSRGEGGRRAVRGFFLMGGKKDSERVGEFPFADATNVKKLSAVVISLIHATFQL